MTSKIDSKAVSEFITTLSPDFDPRAVHKACVYLTTLDDVEGSPMGRILCPSTGSESLPRLKYAAFRDDALLGDGTFIIFVPLHSQNRLN